MLVIQTWIEISMWLSFAIVFFFYVGYLLIIYPFYRKSRRGESSASFIYPRVSLLVPTYNEAKTIEKKILNIEEIDYPEEKFETIFIDGNSSDQTVKTIAVLEKNCKKPIRVVAQSERRGYTEAIIEGVLNSNGDIVVLTDAGSYHEPSAIKHLVKHFWDKKIGSVTGKEVVLGDAKKIGEELEVSYRFFYDFMRQAETEMDSTPDSKGEILAIRKEICQELIPKLRLHPGASFDSCVPYQAKIMGYRTVYDSAARYYEYAPTSFNDRNKQQARRGASLVGSLLMFKNMIFRKEYGRFGSIILPAHFTMQVLLPWLFLSGLICFVIVSLTDPLIVLALWILIIVAVLIKRSRNFLISFVQSQIALIMAMLRLIVRKDNLRIDTISSTRTK
jgi:biofilm PGA synthesis N-glycosyltransferase PgaC